MPQKDVYGGQLVTEKTVTVSERVKVKYLSELHRA